MDMKAWKIGAIVELFSVFNLEFTQSLILLGNNNQNKEMKLSPIALVVKATEDSWAPLGVYHGR